MDEMEKPTQQARRCYRWQGQSSPACVVCVCMCGTRSVCGGPGGLQLGSAAHFHSVAIATQPVHRLQIRPIVHCTTRGIPYHSPNLHPGPCNSVSMRPRTDTHTHTHTHTHTDRQTDKQTRVNTIHFSLSTTHAKCN